MTKSPAATERRIKELQDYNIALDQSECGSAEPLRDRGSPSPPCSRPDWPASGSGNYPVPWLKTWLDACSTPRGAVKKSTEHLSGGIEYPDRIRVHAARPEQIGGVGHSHDQQPSAVSSLVRIPPPALSPIAADPSMLSLVHFGEGGFDPYPALISLRAPYSETVLYHGSS
nr:hypothetical protein LSAT_8X76321 [Tanacetum cinerariifolium]